MNKKLIYIAAAALGTAALAACDDDFAYPPIVEPESQWAGKENTTIRQVKEEYWQTNNNYSEAVGLSESGEEVILRARVISSDATGNIYNNLFIQEINEDGTPGQAMAIASRTKNSTTKLAAQFPYGAEVCLNLSGIYVGRYAGLFQAGMLSGTEISFMTNDVLLEHLELNSLGKPELVDTMTVDLATLKAAKNDDEQLRYYMGRLVRMDGVKFQNAGQPFAATQTENRYVTDAGGNRMNVRCSNRSTWHENIIPGGEGSVVGILSYFNNDWQVLMIDEKGCIGFDPTQTPGPAPEVKPEGEGTQASPYNVAKALEVTNALAADQTTETDVYVKGKIAAIDEIDTGSYGNATYSIVDVDGGTPFKIFRGYWFNGDKFTAADQLEVGAEVIVLGKLVNFKGNTPEMAQGNRVYSYNGQTSGGDNPTPDPTPGDGVTISAISIPHGDTPTATGDVSGDLTEGGYTIATAKNGGATAPAVNVYNGVGTLRLYADNTVTISGGAMAKIVFTLNTATGAKRYTTFTPSTGALNPAQASDDSSITWTGNATSVTFTVGHDATLGSDGASKRGQVHISSIEIYSVK